MFWFLSVLSLLSLGIVGPHQLFNWLLYWPALIYKLNICMYVYMYLLTRHLQIYLFYSLNFVSQSRKQIFLGISLQMRTFLHGFNKFSSVDRHGKWLRTPNSSNNNNVSFLPVIPAIFSSPCKRHGYISVSFTAK